MLNFQEILDEIEILEKQKFFKIFFLTKFLLKKQKFLINFAAKIFLIRPKKLS